MIIESFPLHWPLGFTRAKSKKYSQFKCTIAQARDGILYQINKMNGRNTIISTNIPVKKDGLPYASQKPVDNDHGVAVYFTLDDEQVVLACDQYYSIWENLRAIENSLEAMRSLERWGCSDILKRTFAGFKALETGASTLRHWTQILVLTKNASIEDIKAAYRKLAKVRHPDTEGGSNAGFYELQLAYEQALREVENG